jgi:PAS domain S-box-containing protein
MVMRDEKKSKAQLIEELQELRHRMDGFERTDSERKQAERNMVKESDSRYRELIKCVSSGVCVYKAVDDGDDFIIVDLNNAGERMGEVKKENVIGKRVTEVFPGVKELGLFDAFKRVWKTGSPEHHNESQYKDERISRWVDNYVYRLPNGEIVAVYDDISERRRTEEALRKSEEKYRVIVENALEGIWAIDDESYTTYVNQHMADMLGYTTDEIMGKPLFNFMDERGREISERNIERRRQGIEETHDFEFIRKDGTRIYTRLETGPLADEDGNYTGALAFISDITESKRALERQEKLGLLFQGLGPDFLENMESVIKAGRDILNGDQMNYCRVDRGRLICALSTDPEEQLVAEQEPEGHICYKVITEFEKAPMAIKELDKTPFSDTDPYVKKHGMKSVLAYPVSVQGQTKGSLTLFTKEERAFTSEEKGIMATLANILGIEEERLAREEEMKDFVDIASHELRHPVTIIKGYAISLRDMWEKLDDDSREEMLDAVDMGADRINRLVLELLNVSRIERGGFTVKKEEVDLQHLVEEALAEIDILGRGNKLGLSISEEIPILYIDPERISEAVYILLDNAMIYSPPGSEINVKAELEENDVIVSVLDRGIGVPEEYRGRIFERFGQVEEALHHSSPGMGMGLYIAKEIVEAHGGRIWCEPREGGGSILRFSLPL